MIDSIRSWGTQMKSIRNILAFPFYFVAFVLHLLCAAFTMIAQKVAGDDHGPSPVVDKIALAVFCCAVVSAAPLYVLTRPVPTVDMTLLVPQTPRPDWRGTKTEFAPDQIVWVKPLMRLTACIFAERAIRHALEPAMVEFAPCGDGGKINTTIDDDYFEAAVSGVAKVNDSDRTFRVTLDHYPPSVSEWGFIATGIEIERAETRVSCASASD